MDEKSQAVVKVFDNLGNIHYINIDPSGEVKHHKKSGELIYDANREGSGYIYDPSEQTREENESIKQALRFAKYYVFVERGYDTLDHIENPAYINAARLAIRSLSEEELAEYFGPLHQQIRSHHYGSVESLFELPESVPGPEAVVYLQDIYLGVDIEESSLAEEARSIARKQGMEIDDETDVEHGANPTSEAIDEWQGFDKGSLPEVNPEGAKFEISDLSGIHVGYPDPDPLAWCELEIVRAESPLDREPDARVEVVPSDPGSLERFRRWLDHHLRCQVRDCFVRMGVDPPEDFRVTGFGKFEYALLYDSIDVYPQYNLQYHLSEDKILDVNLLREAVLFGVFFAIATQGYVYLTSPEQASLKWLVLSSVISTLVFGLALFVRDLVIEQVVS